MLGMETNTLTPQHVRIEQYIRDDEQAMRERLDAEQMAAMFATRSAGLAEMTGGTVWDMGADFRAVEIAVYMYARRAAHHGLVALVGWDAKADRLATYYRRA